MKTGSKVNRPGSSTAIAGLAEHVQSTVTLEKLALPESLRQRLQEIAVQFLQKATKPRSSTLPTNAGVILLFAGNNATVKTNAAAALASHLNLALYRIDLSSTVNKYIGETEKNLRRLFDAAEDGGTILFFDEADALFSKRSEVKDSHDRYANVGINYLLQRMESFQGLIILSSKMKSNIDEAFLRRFRHIVEFPSLEN